MDSPLTIYIDGSCPLCRREARFLERLDRGRGRLRMVDIADLGFDPETAGRSIDELMGRIHAAAQDGSMITGVEVFRRAYRAVGWGWLLAWTAWPGLRWLADAGYILFARYRHLFGGGRAACTDGQCKT
ncbi:MAG: DUF393 domain-containing protein [Phycisphaerales bacterium]|jgi:predicted DCC family thiol-disulfide oxidoreductase YuxK|nr:DUF393 domain-containing protein [Phycisphaerales bacterium]